MNEKDQPQDKLHWVLGGALLLIGVFVSLSLVMVKSQADTVGANGNVNNVSPTFIDVYMTTSADYTQSDNTGGNGGAIDLIPGGTKLVKVTGTVEDLNGSADIQGVSATFYKSSGSPACSPDNNDCYKVNSCTTTNGPTSNQLDFNCTMNLAFYTDSTQAGGPDQTRDWIVSVDVKDIDNAAANNNSLHKEINTLLALSIPGSLNFGTLTIGSQTNSSNNQNMGIEQYGNDEADVEVSMPGPLNCAIRGAIPTNNVKWSLTDVDFSDVSTVALSNTPTNTFLNVPYRTNDASPQMKTLFWNIAVPPGGIEGACSNNITITALAH